MILVIKAIEIFITYLIIKITVKYLFFTPLHQKELLQFATRNLARS